MRTAIKERVSRRTYAKEPLSADEIARLRELCAQANAASGLSIELLEDGSAAFDSLRKSYGMFTGVRSLLLMKGPADDPHLAEKIGYVGEGMVLDATDMGLGTCWVGGTFDRGTLSIPAGEALNCVITIGHVPSPTLRERAIRSAMSKKRKPVLARLTVAGGADEGGLPSWLAGAIEAVRLAPSAVNAQKPHFTYADGTLTAEVDETYDFDLVDLGIAKRHFVEEAGGTFALGNGAAWTR